MTTECAKTHSFGKILDKMWPFTREKHKNQGKEGQGVVGRQVGTRLYLPGRKHAQADGCDNSGSRGSLVPRRSPAHPLPPPFDFVFWPSSGGSVQGSPPYTDARAGREKRHSTREAPVSPPLVHRSAPLQQPPPVEKFFCLFLPSRYGVVRRRLTPPQRLQAQTGAVHLWLVCCHVTRLRNASRHLRNSVFLVCENTEQTWKAQE